MDTVEYPRSFVESNDIYSIDINHTSKIIIIKTHDSFGFARALASIS